MTGGGSPGCGAVGDALSQADMVHRLPRVQVVDRIDWLTERCRGMRVIHVGFADTGFWQAQQRAHRWLHGQLAGAAAELVGIDVDAAAVAEAAAAGYDARCADCTDAAAVAALELAPADVVLAGEVIEHVDAPGALLNALRGLCSPEGRLIITTPNACGLINPVAGLLRNVEVTHPDHVVMFTWRTLTELLRRRGWQVTHSATYVPSLRAGESTQPRALTVRALLGAERLLGRLGRPFAADGLIVEASPGRPPDQSAGPAVAT